MHICIMYTSSKLGQHSVHGCLHAIHTTSSLRSWKSLLSLMWIPRKSLATIRDMRSRLKKGSPNRKKAEAEKQRLSNSTHHLDLCRNERVLLSTAATREEMKALRSVNRCINREHVRSEQESISGLAGDQSEMPGESIYLDSHYILPRPHSL